MIPSNFKSITNVHSDIYSKLITKHEYEVQSKVNEDVFQSFIDHWVSEVIPNININNISQYRLLSQEFDRMTNLINIFLMKNGIIQFLIAKKSDNNTIFQAKSKYCTNKKSNFKKAIDILIDTEGFNINSNLPEYKKKLHEVCDIGDVDFVGILSKKIIIKDDVVFVINEKEKTAEVLDCIQQNADLFIPRTIEYKSQELLVTGIIGGAFQCSNKIKSIKFADDSEIKKISKYSFSYSSLEEITIPSHVTIIEEFAFSFCRGLKKIDFQEKSELRTIAQSAFRGIYLKSISIPSCVDIQGDCFFGINDLVDIKIIPTKEQNIIYYNDSFILGKSSPDQENYDVLILSRKDIENVTIPSFIKHIGQCAFHNCKKIEHLEFEQNSELISIGENAFTSSSIKSIIIPKHVTIIKKFAFLYCKELTDFQVDEESELRAIEDSVFSNSSLERISIPSSIVSFGSNCFDNTFKLTTINIIPMKEKNILYYDNSFILGKSSPEQINYNVIILARRDIQEITIPSFIQKIGEHAFENCTKIQSFKILEKSELTIIDKYSFSRSSIKNISFPKTVVNVGFEAFSFCAKLEKVEFPKDSNLMELYLYSFQNCSIKHLSIPSSIIYFDEKCLIKTENLENIVIFPRKKQNIMLYNNSLIIGKSSSYKENYDVIFLSMKNIKTAIIPSFIKKILPYAFQNTNIEKIEFAENSELEIISNFAFAYSSISKILIPSHVQKIGGCCFFGCKQLKKVEFQKNSELRLIEESAFYNSALRSISLPSSISELKPGWCVNVKNLINIEVFQNKEQNIMYYNNSLLLGKSSNNQKNFDVLLFARRNIRKVTIPSFIKRIESYALFECSKFERIEFPPDSELTSIGDSAFGYTSITSFAIPKNVIEIKNDCFCGCFKLKIVEIPDNMKENVINDVFAYSRSVLMIPYKNH